MSRCSRYLKENLFLLHRELCPALLQVRTMAEDICENHLMVAIDPGTTYSLEEFSECQLAKMGFVSTCSCLNYMYLYMCTCNANNT